MADLPLQSPVTADNLESVVEQIRLILNGVLTPRLPAGSNQPPSDADDRSDLGTITNQWGNIFGTNLYIGGVLVDLAVLTSNAETSILTASDANFEWPYQKTNCLAIIVSGQGGGGGAGGGGGGTFTSPYAQGGDASDGSDGSNSEATTLIFNSIQHITEIGYGGLGGGGGENWAEPQPPNGEDVGGVSPFGKNTPTIAAAGGIGGLGARNDGGDPTTLNGLTGGVGGRGGASELRVFLTGVSKGDSFNITVGAGGAGGIGGAGGAGGNNASGTTDGADGADGVNGINGYVILIGY